MTKRFPACFLTYLTEIKEYKFKFYNDSWGFREFLSTKELQDATLGFLEDGWITLSARIEVLNEQNAR